MTTLAALIERRREIESRVAARRAEARAYRKALNDTEDAIGRLEDQIAALESDIKCLETRQCPP